MIRPAEVGDGAEVLELVRRAFSHHDRDGAEEVGIVEETWRRGSAVQPIDLVSVDDDGTIAGHVLAAVGHAGPIAAPAVAPLAVLPERQLSGVGSALMPEMIRRADEAGWPMILLLGNPAYYVRFGFEPAGPLGLTYRPVGENSPAFQLRRLSTFSPPAPADFTYCWEE